MSKQRKKRINNPESGKIWFWSLTGILLLGFLAYGGLVRGAIVKVVTRQNLGTELTILSSRVLELETAYLKAKGEITLAKAYDLGFIEAPTKKFVMTNTKTPELSLLVNGN
jgi:hypothetical protein